MHPDVLALIGAAEDPAGTRRLDPADEHLAGLGAAAGAREIGAGRDQVQEIEARLLGGFAPCHLGRVLAGLDDPGHRLDQPGIVEHPHGPDPELLDENDLAALGIERQHRHSMAALEHLADQFRAHATSKEPVTQAVAEDLEMAIVRDGLLEHREPRI